MDSVTLISVVVSLFHPSSKFISEIEIIDIQVVKYQVQAKRACAFLGGGRCFAIPQLRTELSNFFAVCGNHKGLFYGRDWGYEQSIAPKVWNSKFPGCAGVRQSPINIDLSHVVVNSSLGRILLHGFKDKRVYNVKNIGSTVLLLPIQTDPPIGLVNGEDR